MAQIHQKFAKMVILEDMTNGATLANIVVKRVVGLHLLKMDVRIKKMEKLVQLEKGTLVHAKKKNV